MSNPNAKGRPRLQRGKDAVRVSITLPPKLLTRLKKSRLKKEGRPVSELVRLAIEVFLDAGYGN